MKNKEVKNMEKIIQDIFYLALLIGMAIGFCICLLIDELEKRIRRRKHR
jgi:Na+-driven multidrug efflux pump